MAPEATAFAPGHITAFFQAHDDPDPLRKGSRGVGICLTRGVRTTVRAHRAPEARVRVAVNGGASPGEVSARAAEILMGGKPWEVEVEATAELPISQGFGMSGAGALSTALALNEAAGLGRPRDEVIAAAHRAEVTAATGLGDVYPQALGGIDVRLAPGAPPHGRVETVAWEGEILLCVIGAPIATTDVLADRAFLERIGRVGGKCVDAFAADRRLENLFMLARRFDQETGLADQRILKAMEECRAHGNAAISMLGHALFAVGDMLNLKRVLRPYGYLLPCAVANRGAHLVDGDNHGERVKPDPG